MTFHTGTDEVIFSQEEIDVASKITLEKTIFGEDFCFLRSAVHAAVPKITIPSINMAMMAVHRGNYSGVYARREEVAADMARAYSDEISGLAALGCTYLQIDDVSFSLLCNEQMRTALTPAGTDPSRMHLESIKLFNESLRNRPPCMTICTHTCRGNFRSGWITSGGYDSIAEPYLGELAVDGFFLEYDERSGSFAPLRFEFDEFRRIAREKRCGYQVLEGRDLFCSAHSVSDSFGALGKIGLKTFSATSEHDCFNCALPDSRFLCSHLQHPQVAVDQILASRSVRDAKCGKDRSEIKAPSLCHAGGHDCCEYLLLAEEDEPPTYVAPSLTQRSRFPRYSVAPLVRKVATTPGHPKRNKHRRP